MDLFALQTFSNQIFGKAINSNSLDNKGSCWILKNLYCSVTMLMEIGLMNHYSLHQYLIKDTYTLDNFTTLFKFPSSVL